MHLQISLLLQKQGFFSTVDLAGPTPPLQRYPPGTQPSQTQPSSEGQDREAALVQLVQMREELVDSRRRSGIVDNQEVVNARLDAEAEKMSGRGFTHEDIAWARQRADLSTQQLVEDGVQVEVMGLTVEGVPLDSTSRTIEQGIITNENRASRRLWLGLKYWNGEPVLRKAKMVSKPTKRIWLNRKELERVVRGQQAGEVKGLTRVGEIMAVSTDRGIMDVRECVERQIGGQPLARFWG